MHESGATPSVKAHHHVVQHAQIFEELDVLERPGDARGGDRVWAQRIQHARAQPHLALGRCVDPRHDIDQRALA